MTRGNDQKKRKKMHKHPVLPRELCCWFFDLFKVSKITLKVLTWSKLLRSSHPRNSNLRISHPRSSKNINVIQKYKKKLIQTHSNTKKILQKNYCHFITFQIIITNAHKYKRIVVIIKKYYKKY